MTPRTTLPFSPVAAVPVRLGSIPTARRDVPGRRMSRFRLPPSMIMKLQRLFLVLGCAAVLAGCDAILTRSDVPVSREVAAAKLGAALPASASNVYFVRYAGPADELRCFVRFDVPRRGLDQAVNAVLAEVTRLSGRSLPYRRQKLSAAPDRVPRAQLQPMPWWDISTIEEGYYRGETLPYSAQVWADTGRSRVYVNVSD